MKRIGKYELLAKLGQGAFGTVYKARQVSTGRIVAVKVLDAVLGMSRKARERFVREARAMAKLRHPGIVTVYEVDQERGTPFLSMEFIDGRTLAQVLEDGPPDERQAAEWMAQIAEAVDHAHAHGIVHRDLKPSNVLIDASGRAVVTDFGLAKDVLADTQLTASNEVVGTPSYMSPEQVEGRPVDARSDVFSLGSVLYALLTGHAPFRGRATAVMLQVAERDPEPPSRICPDVSRELEAICHKAMQKVPEGRYASAEAMAKDLRAFLSDSPVTARPDTPLRRVLRKARRSWRAVALWGTALLALGIAGVIALARGTGPAPNPPPAVDPGAAAKRAAAELLGAIDTMVVAKEYARALTRCRQALTTATDPALVVALNQRVEWVQKLKQASATLPGTATPAATSTAASTTTSGADKTFHDDLRNADVLLTRGAYDQAITVYKRLLATTLTDTKRKAVQQRLSWAEQLRASPSATTPGTTTRSTTGLNVADGDRLLAACKFDEAAAVYGGAGADATRRELAQRLIDLRGRAAKALAGGRRVPITLRSGARATLCSLDRSAAVLADAAGTVSAHSWESLDGAGIYTIYKACFDQPNGDDRLGLGALCIALGLVTEAGPEFAQAARLSSATQFPAQRFQALRLAR